MENKDIQLGGWAGASIAFIVTIIAVPLYVMAASRGPRDPFLEPTLFGSAIGSALCVSVILAALGYFAGLEGARTKTVLRAFIKGAGFFACAMGVFGVFTVFLIATGDAIPFALLVLLNFSCLIIATGSLISGMAAIVVRDYRQFGRMRWIPQFSLQELMIVTTLVAVILSTMTSAVILRSQ